MVRSDNKSLASSTRDPSISGQDDAGAAPRAFGPEVAGLTAQDPRDFESQMTRLASKKNIIRHNGDGGKEDTQERWADPNVRQFLQVSARVMKREHLQSRVVPEAKLK